jgi:hypothetical protein
MKKPKITNSNKLYNIAKKIIPGGSQTFSKGVTQFVEGFAPKYLHRGKGAYVWDVDKNKYLDYVMGCQPIILGYSDPDINKAVVEQSNTQWRRNVNTANTAMQNQINSQNAQNSFAMSQTGMAFMWQELRDQADYDFREGENEKNRISQLVNTALASDPDRYGSSVNDIKDLIASLLG